MEAKVVFLAHRVEFLDLLKKEADGYDALILEEPNDLYLKKLLDGHISIEEYVVYSDTNFPRYVFHQAHLLRDLHKKGLKIIQVEPYLETIEKIHTSIKAGKFKEYTSSPEVKKVLETEREAVGRLIEYQEELMRGEFDKIVEKIIEFSIKDSERFRLRDYMRAEAISKLPITGEILVEAGYLHILLPTFLEEFNIKVETVNLLERACKMINQEYYESPGDILTKTYILKEQTRDDPKLLAAQSLIYACLVTKEEKLPTPENPFPHLIEEIDLAKKTRNMNYEECREKFQKYSQKQFLKT